MMKISSKDEMAKFARDFCDKIINGLICMTGEVGVGKSFFVSNFIAEICQIKPEYVISPTFNILQIYKTEKFYIYHFDLYRIKSKSELREIGIYDIIDSMLSGENSVILVEWPELIEPYLNSITTNKPIYKIKIEYGESSEYERIVSINKN